MRTATARDEAFSVEDDRRRTRWRKRVGCGCLLVVLIAAAIPAGFMCYIYLLSSGYDAGYRDMGMAHEEKENDFYANRTPVWTSDGESLIVNVGPAIYGVNRAGDAMWRIPEKRRGSQHSPSLSPNGRIAYVNYEYARVGFIRSLRGDSGPVRRHLETVNVDGTDVQQVRRLCCSPSVPAWSPDGAYIAFVSRLRLGDELLSGMHLFGSRDTPVARLETVPQGSWIKWSGDGTHIAFLARGHSRIAISEFDSDARRLTVSFSPIEERHPYSQPGWSPANDRVYYTAGVAGEPSSGSTVLRSMTVDGAEDRLVASLAPKLSIHNVSVSPLGDQLLLTDRGTPTVYLLNVNGTNLRQLVALPLPGDPPFAAPPLYERYPPPVFASWSPDGKRIAILHGHPDSRTVLFTISPDGSDHRILIRRATDGSLQPAQGS